MVCNIYAEVEKNKEANIRESNKSKYIEVEPSIFSINNEYGVIMARQNPKYRVDMAWSRVPFAYETLHFPKKNGILYNQR